MQKVNLFIIGAPKCGTTSLCEYLSEHPDINFSNPKEPKYFHTDFNKLHRYALTEKQYHSCFSVNKKPSIIVGEGTVWYLYSRDAIKNIMKYNSKAKFIVMIRNPIELAYSLHSQLLFGGDEVEHCFKKAWFLQESRKNNINIPLGCRDKKSLMYGPIASLGQQVKRLLKLVDRESVMFVIFDDFKLNPRKVYLQALNHLGLMDDGKVDFEIINRNRILRPGPLPKLIHYLKYLKNLIGIKKSFGVWSALQPILSRKAKREVLDPVFRAELCHYFQEDLALLSKLLERDLSKWIK